MHLICGSGICNNGDIRLVNGADNREGRVEICDSEVWGTICDDGWDSFEAAVVCYQLGYGRQGVLVCVRSTWYNSMLGMYVGVN